MKTISSLLIKIFLIVFFKPFVLSLEKHFFSVSVYEKQLFPTILTHFMPLVYVYTFLYLCLTLSWRRPLSYRNQSIDLRYKSMDWFLYDNGFRHERVKKARGFMLFSGVIERD